MAKSKSKFSNGGAEGLPGAKKNKSMNAYAKGGEVDDNGADMVSGMPVPKGGKGSSGTARGGGKSTKGLKFKVV